jgi:hypothetical protein
VLPLRLVSNVKRSFQRRGVASGTAADGAPPQCRFRVGEEPTAGVPQEAPCSYDRRLGLAGESTMGDHADRSGRRDCSWPVAIVQHNGSAPASDYCFTAPERLLAPSMSANASALTMPRSAVAMLLECAVVRFRGAEPECCWAWKGEAVPGIPSCRCQSCVRAYGPQVGIRPAGVTKEGPPPSTAGGHPQRK